MKRGVTWNSIRRPHLEHGPTLGTSSHQQTRLKHSSTRAQGPLFRMYSFCFTYEPCSPQLGILGRPFSRIVGSSRQFATTSTVLGKPKNTWSETGWFRDCGALRSRRVYRILKERRHKEIVVLSSILVMLIHSSKIHRRHRYLPRCRSSSRDNSLWQDRFRVGRRVV